MTALIVLLPPGPAAATTEFDFAVSADGSSVARHGAAVATVLPPPSGAGAEIVAVVPSSMLSWHRAELPKGMTPRSPRLRAVLEGLLEDRLLDEPESLHFAVQPQARAEAGVWVATCDRAWLRDALQVLEDAGRPVTRIVPEFAPQQTPAVYAIGEEQEPSLAVTGPDGVTVLPLSAAALPLLPTLPPDTPLVAEPAVAHLAEQVLQHRPVLQHPADRWLQSARTDWDLAQFEFSRSGRTRALKRLGTAWSDVLASPQWRPARWGAIALVAINVVSLNAHAWRERSALDAKRDAMTRLLTATFPNVKVVVDAPVQMEKEVAALRQATGASSARDLEAMLSAVANALPPQKAVSGVDYTGAELRLKGLALNPEESRQLAARLRPQGYGASTSGDTLVVNAEARP